MVAVLPAPFAGNQQPRAKDLREMWFAAETLSNIAGFSQVGTGVLTGGGSTTNAPIGPAVDFVKIGTAEETFLITYVNVTHFWATWTNPQHVQFGVSIGNGAGVNIDLDVCGFFPAATLHHESSSGVQRFDGAPAGPYAPQLFYRVTGGTITINNGDTITLFIAEIPFGG